jgi:hypothetical protein
MEANGHVQTSTELPLEKVPQLAIVFMGGHWSRSAETVMEKNLLFLPGVIRNNVGSSAV